MGKKNRRKGEGPRRRVVPGMAEDATLPQWAVEQGQLELERKLHAGLFASNYTFYVRDGGFDIPGRGEPRREGETEQEFEDRREAARQAMADKAWIGTWKDGCERQTHKIRPSDAESIALKILWIGQDWRDASGHLSTVEGFRAGAGKLLDAMCPGEHRDAAGVHVDFMAQELVATGIPVMPDDTEQFPIASLHAAAAMTGWLFSEPACVSNQAATQLALTRKTEKVYDSLNGPPPGRSPG